MMLILPPPYRDYDDRYLSHYCSAKGTGYYVRPERLSEFCLACCRKRLICPRCGTVNKTGQALCEGLTRKVVTSFIGCDCGAKIEVTCKRGDAARVAKQILVSFDASSPVEELLDGVTGSDWLLPEVVDVHRLNDKEANHRRRRRFCGLPRKVRHK